MSTGDCLYKYLDLYLGNGLSNFIVEARGSHLSSANKVLTYWQIGVKNCAVRVSVLLGLTTSEREN